jgi:hypothetical protein
MADPAAQQDRPAERTEGPERRRLSSLRGRLWRHRLSCLRLGPGSGQALGFGPGRILNFEPGQLRTRTDERFNVGIYVRVEAEFYLHGLSFRVGGMSQAILDKNTIGVRFVDKSQGRREQLAELIAEIAEEARESPRCRAAADRRFTCPSDLLYKFSCSMSTIEWTPLPFRPNVKENRKCRRHALCHTWRDSPPYPWFSHVAHRPKPQRPSFEDGRWGFGFFGAKPRKSRSRVLHARY